MAPFSIPVRVYWEDTDAGGVVYYANYLRYMERARSDWLRSLGVDQVRLLREERRQFVVVEARIRYLKAARLDERLSVSVQLDEKRGASIVMSQEIRRGPGEGGLLVSAAIRAACVDSDNLRPRPLPAALAALD